MIFEQGLGIGVPVKFFGIYFIFATVLFLFSIPGTGVADTSFDTTPGEAYESPRPSHSFPRERLRNVAPASALNGVKQLVIVNGRSSTGFFSGNLPRIVATCQGADCGTLKILKYQSGENPTDEFEIPKEDFSHVLNFARWNEKPSSNRPLDAGPTFAVIMPAVVGSIFLSYAAPDFFQHVLVTTMGVGGAVMAYWAALIPSKVLAAHQIMKADDSLSQIRRDKTLQPNMMYVNVSPRAFRNIGMSLKNWEEHPYRFECSSSLRRGILSRIF